MRKEKINFEKKGYPTINIYDNYFEIKDIDYWKFRKFSYTDVKSVTLINPNDSWWNKLYSIFSLKARIYSKEDPWKLKVLKKGNGDWTYNTSSKYDLEFRKVIKTINKNLELKQMNLERFKVINQSKTLDIIEYTEVEIYEKASQVVGIEGMTVNERLYLSGLIDTFDKAIKIDKKLAKTILRAIKVDEKSIEKIVK